VYPHPKNQQAVLMVDAFEEVADNLSSFSPSEAELEDLKIFRPATWTLDGIRRKLGELYTDMETNVTRIYGRSDLHLVIDLTYFSLLSFHYDGRLTSGWLNSLVIGDSSQGKSECFLQMKNFYGLGEICELKSASRSGLIGGLQQIGTRWFVSWGVIPTQDRRLVCLEEVKGASVETIGSLTGMRSSGIAEIPKIERRKSHARTRLLFNSNPRGNRSMASFNFGIEAINELIGSLEDVRRFDIALIVSASDVDPKIINEKTSNRPKVPQKHTAELNRRGVLYAWTRAPDQVEFPQETTDLIATETLRLCGMFTETMPLVDRGSMRFKLARLSAALAARTFSTRDDDLAVVVIRPCHVEMVVRFISEIYGRATFGYADFTRAESLSNCVIDAKMVNDRLAGSKHPRDFVQQLLHRDRITVDDIQDWSEVGEETARSLLSYLVRKHCLYREDRSYTKTPAFILLLKALEPRLSDKPEVGKDEEF
jgi:hypothetical protein